MEEKTKKKRVQKRAVRKKTKATESVSVAAAPAVKAEKKKPRKSSRAKSASDTPKLIVHLPTFEQVQLRAYFISERRRKLGLPGDESHDWLAAEQELREELSV
ncbi:MAG: DUF2934 domain-containing protein [Verrucomicrobia bacterium]|nr:DUF2934 domain-containing protein [Verrucomicrobiota bacterium]MBV8276107.1 DUF2934 domain-containing protein [Verrucomicrobiota bacterium]